MGVLVTPGTMWLELHLKIFVPMTLMYVQKVEIGACKNGVLSMILWRVLHEVLIFLVLMLLHVRHEIILVIINKIYFIFFFCSINSYQCLFMFIFFNCFFFFHFFFLQHQVEISRRITRMQFVGIQIAVSFVWLDAACLLHCLSR